MFSFSFILPDPYSPNGNCHLNHNASIDADFFKEVPLGVSRLAKTVQGSYLPPKIEKNFLTAAKA
jgi:hypothetical protein